MNEEQTRERGAVEGRGGGGGWLFLEGLDGGKKKVREGRGVDPTTCTTRRLPNRERAERPSHRHTVDYDVIHGQYVLAFDWEHYTAFDDGDRRGMVRK
jgi:hypothetical protein